VPFAQEQAIPPHHPSLLAAFSLEGMIELAKGLAPCVLSQNMAAGHE